MRRILIPLLLLLLACRAGVPAAPTLTPVTPTVEPTVANTVTPVPPPLPTLPQTEQEIQEFFELRLHPDGPLYVGDLVSLEVIAASEASLEGVQVQVQTPDGSVLGPVEFGGFGIASRTQATLYWAWDTAALEPGEHSLTFSILPNGPVWDETVSLLPQEEQPYPQARWAITESDCCIIYYITGTEAERDLDQLLDIVDEQAESASQQLGAEFTEPVPLVFLPRVLGHGGFASSEISVSYLDQNYAGSSPELVLHHEMIHILDGRLGGDLRPSLFVEGLAVYLTGGHFKPEPLLPRAAALIDPLPGCISAEEALTLEILADPICGLGQYVPLVSLFDNFYFAQHEVGYLQAAALVAFMVETWTYEEFEAFYRSIPSGESGRQSVAVDAALQAAFGLSLTELEGRFIKRLRAERLTPENLLDMELTIDYYDTVRRYQKILDPSAYFLTAWLPGTTTMRERSIVADYLRRPNEPENQAVEILLVAADQALRKGEFNNTRRLLEVVNAMLDPFSADQTDRSGNYP